MADAQSTSYASEKEPSWQYGVAFSRNLGLISRQEQQLLRESRVAIPGMGGVGGIHLITLARLGVGKFRIADPDEFEVANFNRQYGAELTNVGRNKAEAMAEKALAVNPDLDIEFFREPIGSDNVKTFLADANVLVDGIDYFNFDVRRLLFQEARARKIWTVTAGPIGFSTAWLLFDPNGMSFDEYFDVRDDMDTLDQFASFTMGVAPRGTHWPYLDLSEVDRESGRGPSAGLACHLASGVVGAEVIKILLKRGSLRPAPCYNQFDAYRCLLRKGWIPWGNRNPLQRFKRRVLRRRMLQMGFGDPQH